MLNNSNKIRLAKNSDIPKMVNLSSQKRQLYAEKEPIFWNPSKHADQEQKNWFKRLLSSRNHIVLVSEKTHINGFIIGELVTAPEVYDPGGLMLKIDDFCVESEILWESVGNALLESINIKSKEYGAKQCIVVCGNHDIEKHRFLEKYGLHIVSNWYLSDS